MELKKTGHVQRKICLPQDPLKPLSPFSGFIVHLEVCEHTVGLAGMCFGSTFTVVGDMLLVGLLEVCTKYRDKL